MNNPHRILSFALTLTISGPMASTSAFAWQAEKITDGLDIPWGLTYVNDGSMLVTEKTGVIKHVDLKTGEQNTLFRLPNVWSKGQGGALDIAFSPLKKIRSMSLTVKTSRAKARQRSPPLITKTARFPIGPTCLCPNPEPTQGATLAVA